MLEAKNGILLLQENIETLIKNGAIGVKAEFAAEGATFNEVLGLKNLADRYDIDFSLKIGGAESKNEIQQAKSLGIKTITVPLIESVYAASKYLETIAKVYSTEEIDWLNICINIETISSLNILSKILEQKFSKKIKSIIFGRSDMACSIGLTKKEVNSEKILALGKEICLLSQEYKKDVIIGGNITTASIPFFEQLADYQGFKKFETRKILFDKEKFFEQSGYEQIKAIELALEFEKNWKATKDKLMYF